VCCDWTIGCVLRVQCRNFKSLGFIAVGELGDFRPQFMDDQQWVPGFEEVEHIGFFSVVDVRCGGLVASSAFHLSRSGSGLLFLCE
jgi:hypothetical protein